MKMILKKCIVILSQIMAVYKPLSNNASTISPSSKLEDISLDRLEKVFVVNAIGNILCAKYAIKYLSKNTDIMVVKSLISHQ